MHERSHNILILATLWLLMFSSSSQFFIVVPILSVIGEELSIAESLRGTLITSYAISLGVFALITGPISDKIGRRKILLYGSGVMTASLFLHNLAFDYFTMISVRALAGIAGGILTGSCVAYVGDKFPSEKRGWANGIVMTGTAVGQIAGIPMGTVLANEFGFNAPFLFFGVTMGITFLMVRFFVPQPAVKLNTEEITLSSMFTGYGKMLKKPVYRSVAFGYLLMFLGMSSFVVYFPTWLETFGATGNDIALIYVVGGTAMVIAGPIAGRISDRKGRKNIIIISNILLAGILLSTIYVIQSISVITYVFFFMLMLVVSGRMIPFQALVSEIASDHSRGKLMCLSISIGQLGMGMGSALSGWLYAYYGFGSNLWLGATAIVSMALLVWRFIPETLKIRSNSPIESELLDPVAQVEVKA